MNGFCKYLGSLGKQQLNGGAEAEVVFYSKSVQLASRKVNVWEAKKKSGFLGHCPNCRKEGKGRTY